MQQQRSQGDAPAATGAQADGPVRLARIGTFASRSTSPRRRATGGGCSSSSRAGGSGSCAAGGSCAGPSSTSRADRLRRRAGPARPRVRARLRASRRFYVYYTNRSGDTRVVEYRRAPRIPTSRDPGSARVVLRQDQPESNHNGGQIAFGPDGLLYIGLGDGGGGNDQHGERGNAQDLGTLLGKILRIDPRRSGGRPYRIPADNPFVGRAGARPEIFSYGLRNPWRFSFDRRDRRPRRSATSARTRSRRSTS